MDAIIVPSKKLQSERRQAVRRLVQPMLPQPPRAEVAQIGISKDAYVVGVVPHGRQPSSFLNPEDALVATKLPSILLNYYESWQQVGRADEYRLDRAYMHMHFAGRPSPRQILSLHCDPSLKPSEAHFRYKRGPHFHIEGASPDICHAHISLCLGDKHFGGQDIQTITASFVEAIQMIVSEVFPCWERFSRRG